MKRQVTKPEKRSKSACGSELFQFFLVYVHFINGLFFNCQVKIIYAFHVQHMF
jgi:hypothetical protein